MPFLPYPPSNTTESIAVLKQDIQLAHDIVHGDDNTFVDTENGLTPSFAKVIKELSSTAGAGSYIGEVAPLTPIEGMRWYNPTVPTTFIYYTDGDSGQWIEEASQSTDGGLRNDAYSSSIKDLKTTSTIPQTVTGFYAGSTVGGGSFIYEPTRSKADHNGGTILDPDRIVAWNGTHADLSTLFTAALSGTGAFKKLNKENLTALDFGAVADGVTVNDISISKAVASFDFTKGGSLLIPSGTKFNIKNLTLPKRSTLVYYEQDDTSPVAGTKKATNELVTFQANANDSGIVNEVKTVAPFHPGHVIEVRKDVLSHNTFIGAGQSQTNPVRASYNILDEGKDICRTIYENYNDYSIFSGVRSHAWLNRVTLNGVGTSSFSVAPVKGNLITGVISGASAHVLTISASQIELVWFSGKFQNGESVVCNRGTIASPVNEASSTTITSIVEELKTGIPVSQGFDTGYISIGLPPSAPKEMFAVGGKSAVTRTRAGGWYLPKTITDPSRVWVDNFELSTPNGYEITYDTVPAAASRRLNLRKYDQTSNIGHIGAVRGHTNFTDAVIPATSGYNIASVVKNSTGDYTITFTTAFARADYTVALSKTNPLDDPYIFAQTTTELRIRNATNGTATLANLLGRVHVSCVGGDI